MSNIHGPGAHHGVDDEFDYGQPRRCASCWELAKKKFFGPDRHPRRGQTLDKVYFAIHAEEHQP